MAKKGTKRTPAKKTASKAAAKHARRAGKTAAKSAAKPAAKSAKRAANKARASAKKTRAVKARSAAARKQSVAKRASRASKTSLGSRGVSRKAVPQRRPRKAAGRASTVEPAKPAEQTTTPRYLSRAEAEEFRIMLLEKRAQLLGDVGTLQAGALRGSRREASGDLSSMPVHMADLGSDNYELEFTLGLIEGERATLQEIDEALERIRNGTYGACLGTGKPIGKARLRARPWAKYCYEHTLALEKGKQRRL